jgi:predicted SprT family Zn-dependent metalloprotease
VILTTETITAEFLVIQKKTIRKYPEFKEKLAAIQLTIKNVTGYYGIYYANTRSKPGKIYISNILMTNSKVLRDTLRHEFAHAVCYIRNKNLSHDEEWATTGKALGIKNPKFMPDNGLSKAQLRNIKAFEKQKGVA